MYMYINVYICQGFKLQVGDLSDLREEFQAKGTRAVADGRLTYNRTCRMPPGRPRNLDD